MSNIKLIGAFARLYCFVEICWNLHPFSELKNVFFANFETFLKFSKCKALGNFLLSFLERVPLKGCLGGISQNWNFWNWFEILDIFRHWLLNSLIIRYIINLTSCILIFRHEEPSFSYFSGHSSLLNISLNRPIGT